MAADGKFYPPQPQATPEKKEKKPFYKRVWFWLLVALVLLLGGCIAIVGSASKTVTDLNNAKHTVVYTVTGDGTANITYASFTNNSNVGSSQDSSATLPWTKTITASGIFSSYDVSAMVNTGTTVTCTLEVDGKVVSTNTAHGQYSSATCTGTNP